VIDWLVIVLFLFLMVRTSGRSAAFRWGCRVGAASGLM
jgi:hypothetical protein